MKRISKTILLCALAMLTVNALGAETVKAPRGWGDTLVGNHRVVSNGNATVVIAPWESLQGQIAEQWLADQANKQPQGGELISSGPVKKDSVPGSFSVTRKARFGDKQGRSILYLCPGEEGHARLLTLDVHNGGFGDTLKGALFGEKVCKKEPKGVGPSTSSNVASVQGDNSQPVDTSSTTNDEAASESIASTAQGQDISDEELVARNEQIPASQRPASASMYSTKSFSGFPATLQFKVGMAVEFEGGVELACLEWDPAINADLNALAKMDDCEIPGEEASSKIRPFKAAERLALSFGNVSVLSIDGLEGSASSISGRGLQLNEAGDITLDRWRAGHMSAVAATARSTATSKTGVSGRYYLDGYTITIVTNEGETLNGFIGYTLDDKNNIKALFLNGKHYWDRSK